MLYEEIHMFVCKLPSIKQRCSLYLYTYVCILIKVSYKGKKKFMEIFKRSLIVLLGHTKNKLQIRTICLSSKRRIISHLKSGQFNMHLSFISLFTRTIKFNPINLCFLLFLIVK